MRGQLSVLDNWANPTEVDALQQTMLLLTELPRQMWTLGKNSVLDDWPNPTDVDAWSKEQRVKRLR